MPSSMLWAKGTSGSRGRYVFLRPGDSHGMQPQVWCFCITRWSPRDWMTPYAWKHKSRTRQVYVKQKYLMKPPQMSQNLLDTWHSREDLVSLGIQGLKYKPWVCSSGVCAYCHLYACPSVCDISFPLLGSKAFLFYHWLWAHLLQWHYGISLPPSSCVCVGGLWNLSDLFCLVWI